MRLAVRTLSLVVPFLTFWIATEAQTITRELKLSPGATVQIVNRTGRVGVRALSDTKEKPLTPTLVATGVRLTDRDLKISASGGHAAVAIAPVDASKRIDIVLTLPERTNLKIETDAGAIELEGNFASVDAKSDTGTISTSVPTDDLKYSLFWTESRPRYLA